VFGMGVPWLVGCGRATSPQHSGTPATAGSSGVSGAQSIGEGGSDDGTAGGSGGRGGEAGRGVGGSGGVGQAGGRAGSGNASAGAGSGGVQGGAGGNSPLGNLPLPAGCQALSGSATDLLCSLDVDCDAVTQAMRCYRLSSGEWQCTCEAPNADQMFLIEGAAGLDACAVGAGLCAGPDSEPAFVLGSCALTLDELGSSSEVGVGELQSCAVELQCQPPVAVDFAPGVRATMPGGATTRCVEVFTPDRNTEQLRLDCETTGSFGPQSHSIVTSSVAVACRPVLEFYLSTQEPAYDGSERCVGAADDSALPATCRLMETCFDAAPISNQVSLVKSPVERSTFCSLDDLDNLYCGCRFVSAMGSEDTFSYDLGPGTRPATCDLSDCTLETMAEPTGAGACQEQQGAGENDEDSCTDDFYCNQPATLAGREVTISSWLNVRCARADNGDFYCGCGVGDETATFLAGSLASSVEACAMARTACLSHVDLPVGPAPYGTRAPDPLLDL
jgi:hypothetical protein